MKYPLFYITALIAFIFTGCSSSTELTKEYLSENASGVTYSVIYYIHADADYLYHDAEGEAIRGNSEVLAAAVEVGEAARLGEVLIYHQQPEKKLMGLFPRKNSRFYHYQNGQLINKVKYRYPDKNEAFLATEGQLANQYRAPNRVEGHQNYFLYFGHEIPSENGKYHQSLPDLKVNTNTFAKGIQDFLLTDQDRFELVVLSTCNNGTPAMAELLMPFTDAMLASPQNLHLSHIDSDKMKLLESEPEISALKLGHSMAEQTFQRLEKTVHTTITLSLYDFKEVQSYIKSLSSLTETNKVLNRSEQFQDNVDCEETYPFESAAYRQGVETWYKPARFGRKSGKSTHSGWGCKPGVQ